MDKYKNGVLKGVLPILFLFPIEEDKDSNHELRSKLVFTSKTLHNKYLESVIDERILFDEFEIYDLYN